MYIVKAILDLTNYFLCMKHNVLYIIQLTLHIRQRILNVVIYIYAYLCIYTYFVFQNAYHILCTTYYIVYIASYRSIPCQAVDSLAQSLAKRAMKLQAVGPRLLGAYLSSKM